MNTIFKKSLELGSKTEKYLEIISSSLVLLEKSIIAYLTDEEEEFQRTLDQICSQESEADKLEAEIATSLYKYMLLPDARADVLSLVKSLDDIIDGAEDIVKELRIQRPRFTESLQKSILILTEKSLKAAEELIAASHAFFNESHMVIAHVTKIKFYEHEADLIEEKAACDLFAAEDLELAEKLQLRYFISEIARISDEAETIGDKLTIFSIKREV